MIWAPRPGASLHKRRPVQRAGLLIGTGLLGLALLMGMAQSPEWGPAMIGVGNAGMMGSLSLATAAGTLPLTDSELRHRLAAFAASRWPASTLNDVRSFVDNTSAVVVDPVSGQGLAEVLVDRYTGAVRPEPGPGMVWNTQSGRRGSWMGTAAQAPTISEANARALATTFLATYLPGAKIKDGHTLPSHHTFGYRLGSAEGMLSVSARTGEVWRHSWHGPSRLASEASR